MFYHHKRVRLFGWDVEKVPMAIEAQTSLQDADIFL
jgi:hypothetical protein